jgi:threonine-phosphate decarboxylase
MVVLKRMKERRDVSGPIDEYYHGGDPSKDLARFNLTQRTVIDFSTNLNPLGIPPVIREHWPELIEGVKCYPSIEGEGIAEYYRTKFGLPDRNILAGNGSTEIIYLISRSLRLNQVIILTPSFHDYERAAVLSGAKVIRIPFLNEGLSFGVDMQRLVEALKMSDALWLGRPNNPTADLFPKYMINNLASGFPDKWFIIDEAFMQFLDNWEKESFIIGKKKANIIVIHSLTKFYALAGLRMGGLIAHRDVISTIRNSKEPWTVNGVADRAALLLKGCKRYELESRAYVSRERESVIKRLQEIEGITPFSSTANFILCRWARTGDLDDLLRHLLINGIYVRDCRNFPGL